MYLINLYNVVFNIKLFYDFGIDKNETQVKQIFSLGLSRLKLILSVIWHKSGRNKQIRVYKRVNDWPYPITIISIHHFIQLSQGILYICSSSLISFRFKAIFILYPAYLNSRILFTTFLFV